MTNAGKPIYDPFADVPQEPERAERKVYRVFRACGRCGGTGLQAAFRKGQIASHMHKGACSQCLIRRHERGLVMTAAGAVTAWGGYVELFAFELTEPEIKLLTPQEQLGVYCEVGQHHDRRIVAMIADDTEYENTRTKVQRVFSAA